MIFLGDLVFPIKYSDDIINIDEKEFLLDTKLVNFESLIDFNNSLTHKKTPGIALHSSEDIIKFCKKLNVVAGTLANNHITDYDTSIDEQIEFYSKNNITAFGAGYDIKKAKEVFLFSEDGDDYVVLTFGWEVIGCKPAKLKRSGVNPLTYKNVFNEISLRKKEFVDRKMIVIFHWNYEFELYPQPAFRELAFELIDKGVDAIFGHHSHVVQGYEIYKNKPIFYGLGNFFLPTQNYNGYNLNYPSVAKKGIGVKLGTNIENTFVYWLSYSDDNRLKIDKKEKLSESGELEKLSEFSKLNYSKYKNWFRKNRKLKRKFLPIYCKIDGIEGWIFNIYNQLRQRFIYLLKGL